MDVPLLLTETRHLQRSFSPRISGGGLPQGTFVFHQAHFHWGSRDSRGSEHSKSRTFFPLEVQLIHFNTKYRNMEDALGRPDGVAILATLFQVYHMVTFLVTKDQICEMYDLF